MKARDFYDRLQQETCLFGGNCSLFERFVHYDTGVEFNLLKWCAAVLCRYDITCQTTYEVWHRPALSWKMIGWLYCDTSRNDTVLRDKMHWKQCDAYNQTIDNESVFPSVPNLNTPWCCHNTSTFYWSFICFLRQGWVLLTYPVLRTHFIWRAWCVDINNYRCCIIKYCVDVNSIPWYG